MGYKHGLRYNKFYNIWKAMIQRCEHESCKSYKNYGGRGISVCKEWHNVTVFVSWAEQQKFKRGWVIDRKNNNGNYNSENCRFVTRSINNYNTRTHGSCEYDGVWWDKVNRKYQTQIKLNGKTLFCERYNSAYEASLARNIFILENNLPHKLMKG